MNQKSLCRWLRSAIIGIGVCGALVYFWLLPMEGESMAVEEFAGYYWPWLSFLWGTAIPCYATLIFGWIIAGEIGKNNAFSRKNAKLMKYIAYMAAGDIIYFFIGNVVLAFLGMSHPGVVIMSLIIIFVGLAITIAAAALSHLIFNAAELREENELTI